MKAIKLLVLSFASTAILSFSPVSKKIIVIDAGHGGTDMGATYNEVTEKQIVLGVASQIKKLSKSQNDYEIVLTRDSDASTSLSERTEKINKLNPDMVISLHINRTPGKETTKKGHEIFTQNSDASKKLAKMISDKFGSCTIEEKNLHILRESKSPTVLVELGFINNKQDRDFLSSEAGQKEVASKFVEVISEK